MYYRASNTIGLRRKFGDYAQALSFGGKHCGCSEQVLRGFATMALKKLDDGQSEAAVKTWAVNAISGD